MFNEKYLMESQKLYEKIYGKVTDYSEEFINFVNGNPHPLRIKLAEDLEYIINQISMSWSDVKIKEIDSLVKKRDLLKELERIVMEYIETKC